MFLLQPGEGSSDGQAVTLGMEPRRTCCDEFEDIAANMWSGLKLCWKHKAVRWRLVFLGLETAFEDAMISLVIMEYCINVRRRSSSCVLVLCPLVV